MAVSFGVLGPVVAWDGAGAEIALGGPRQKAVLARLLIAEDNEVIQVHLARPSLEDVFIELTGRSLRD